MRKVLLTSLLCGAGVLNTNAASVTTATVDNFWEYLIVLDSSNNVVSATPFGGGNHWDWITANTENLALTSGSYTLVYQGRNESGAGSTNPAAFLAVIDGPGLVFGSIETDENWTYTDTIPAVDPYTAGTSWSGASWSVATSYGANGVAPWGTIADIPNTAEWIWDASNTDGAETLWFRSPRFTYNVPDTANSSALMMAALGALLFVRRPRNA